MPGTRTSEPPASTRTTSTMASGSGSTTAASGCWRSTGPRSTRPPSRRPCSGSWSPTPTRDPAGPSATSAPRVIPIPSPASWRETCRCSCSPPTGTERGRRRSRSPASSESGRCLYILEAIGWVLELLTFVILVRVFLSWIPGLNPYHPVVRLIRAVADPILAPFRGVLPRFGGMLDLSPILAIVVLQIAAQILFSLAQDVFSGISLAAIVVQAAEQLVLTLIVIVAVLVLLRFVLSLFHADPWHPLPRGIQAMARPFTRPFDGMVSHRSTLDVEALIAFAAYLVLFLLARFALDRLVGLLA